MFYGNFPLNRGLVRLAAKLWIVRLVFLQDAVDGSQQHFGDSDNRFLVSAPLFDGIVAVGNFRGPLVSDGAESALN